MNAAPAGVRVLVATKPVDFRRGADSLAALAREQLQRDPLSGADGKHDARATRRISARALLSCQLAGARPPGPSPPT